MGSYVEVSAGARSAPGPRRKRRGLIAFPRAAPRLRGLAQRGDERVGARAGAEHGNDAHLEESGAVFAEG